MTSRRTLYWIIAGAGALAIAGVTAGPLMSRVEQPGYRVLHADGAIEVRAYDPMIVAGVTLQGERNAALSDGFQLIASYIFGANKPNARIAMTAPAGQHGVQKIAMTAPRQPASRWRCLDGPFHHAPWLELGDASGAQRSTHRADAP